MATQFLPVMAMIAPPLYARIDILLDLTAAQGANVLGA
jgi:hypothetical protein